MIFETSDEKHKKIKHINFIRRLNNMTHIQKKKNEWLFFD